MTTEIATRGRLERRPATRRARSGQLARWLPIATLGPLLALLVVAPLALLAVSSVKPTGLALDPGFSFENYARAYLDPTLPGMLLATLVFVAGSAGMALVIAGVLTWLVERTDLPGRRVLAAILLVPMAIPPILFAIAWSMLLSPRIGFFNTILRSWLGLASAPFDIFTMGGMIFVQGMAMVPSTMLILGPAFRNMDPSLEEAAIASGAGPFMMLRRVVVPMLMPAILGAAFYLFIAGFVVFDIPGTLGLPVRIFVLSSQMFYYAQPITAGLPRYGEISALGMLLLVVLLLLAIGYRWATRQASRFATLTGRGYRPRAMALRGWRYPALALVLAYILLSVVSPLAILIWNSLLPFQSVFSLALLDRLTLANHWQVLADRRLGEAAWNTAIIAIIAATVVSLLSLLLAWVVVRSQAVGRRLIDTLAFVPLAIPGVMLGVSLIYLYLSIQVVPIYGTIWIICIAYVTTFLAFGTRAAGGVMVQMHSELEEAATASGAGWWRTFRRITIPLMLPALLAIWMWSIAHAVRDMSTALMLSGQDNTVLTTLMWNYWSTGQGGRVAAMGVWLTLLLIAVIAAWQLAGGWLGRRFGIEDTR